MDSCIDLTSEPVLIPIRFEDGNDEDGGNNTDDVPEWAMIEVNGELVLPNDLLLQDRARPQNGKENSSVGVSSSLTSGEESSESQSVVSPNRIELGSLRFVDKARGDVFSRRSCIGVHATKIPTNLHTSRRSLILSCYPFQKPVMILGSHELTGNAVEKLAKPFCVLQRSDDGKSYHVKGVVTRKVLLNQYPKIIMR
jgi:hypothetical protein